MKAQKLICMAFMLSSLHAEEQAHWSWQAGIHRGSMDAYWEHGKVEGGVLLLVPGYNGSGAAMLDEDWKAFARREHVVLLAPTFFTKPEELRFEAISYYHPHKKKFNQNHDS